MQRKRKVIFIYPNTAISENAFGGGGVVMRNHLELLSEQFSEIYLLQYLKGDGEDLFEKYFQSNPDELAELSKLFKTRTVIRLQTTLPQGRLRNYLNLIANPMRFVLPYLTVSNKKQFQQLLNDIKPDLIWAEHIDAPIMVTSFGDKRDVPMIYSHHDWEYKLRTLRNNRNQHTLRYRLITKFIKRKEEEMVKKADAVITSSDVESKECKILGAKIVQYIPLFVAEPKHEHGATDNGFTLYHLGGMQTTANRAGLENFLTKCWPKLKKETPGITLKLIGSIEGAGRILTPLLDDPAIIKMGYIRDVDSELHPYALHIIPWNHNTGFRTKVPMVMRNRQVVAGLRDGLLGYRELVDGQNVILADDYDSLTEKIIAISRDLPALKKMGENSFATFENFFRISRQRTVFVNFIKSVMKE